MSLSTQKLIDEIRDYSNLKNNQYFTDTQILRFANDAKDELFDIVVSSFEHYRTKTFDFTLSGSTSSVDLPSDFYKQNLLEINPGTSQVQTVNMIGNYLERNQGVGPFDVYGGPGANRKFLIEDDHLTIVPQNQSSATAGNYRLYYTPLLGDFSFPLQVDLHVEPDLVVAAISAYPFEGYPTVGTWTQPIADRLILSVPEDDLPLTVDSYQIRLNDLLFIQKDDAPLSEENMGVWQYTGVANSGGSLFYTFDRAPGFRSQETEGDIIQAGFKVHADKGSQYISTTMKTDIAWAVGLDTTEISFTNFMRADPFGVNDFVFYSDVFTYENLQEFEKSTWSGAVIRITPTLSFGPNDSIDWPIVNVTPTHQARISEPIGHGFTAWQIYENSIVTVTWPDSIYEVPTILLPWKLYIVVHASITIRAARQQDTSELETKLGQLKARIAKMSANRTEQVSSAPFTRRGRRSWWGGF